MKSFKNDFRTVTNNDSWYDLFEDWELIASSLKAQYRYGIRREIDKLSWAELSSDIAGLMPETPLGNIVSIRSENDKEKLKYFTKEQHKIRNDWRTRTAKQVSEKDMSLILEQMKQALIKMAGETK